MPDYGKRAYWDERYADEDDAFDWLWDYSSVRANLRRILRRDSRILVVGCGNANFSADLYDDGFRKCVSIDNSEVVIRQMRRRCPHMDWRVMDVLKMSFPDGAFDVVLDKSLIDTLLCYDSSARCVGKMVKEIHRVLAPGGRYVSMSLHSGAEILRYFSPVLAAMDELDEMDGPSPEEQRPEAPPADWYVQWCQLRNPRWSATAASDRSVAHTFVLCTKQPPPDFVPTDFVNTLSAEDILRLQAEADCQKTRPATRRSWRECAVEHLLECLDRALEQAQNPSSVGQALKKLPSSRRSRVDI